MIELAVGRQPRPIERLWSMRYSEAMLLRSLLVMISVGAALVGCESNGNGEPSEPARGQSFQRQQLVRLDAGEVSVEAPVFGATGGLSLDLLGQRFHHALCSHWDGIRAISRDHLVTW